MFAGSSGLELNRSIWLYRLIGYKVKRLTVDLNCLELIMQ